MRGSAKGGGDDTLAISEVTRSIMSLRLNKLQEKSHGDYHINHTEKNTAGLRAGSVV